MSKQEEFIALQKRVENTQRQVDKAEGAKEQVMSTLKSKFACTTVSQAKKKLSKLKEQVEALSIEYDESKETFEQKWSDGEDDE